MDLYEFTVKNRQQEDVSLSKYKGNVLLIVNTATHWGLTPQYAGLEILYRRYKDKGFEILDFPCNQFNNQAPGTDEEIYNFIQEAYHPTFEMFSKIDVNGENAIPLYKWLKTQTDNTGEIAWNFVKFLIDREGKVIKRYDQHLTAKDIENDVKSLL